MYQSLNLVFFIRQSRSNENSECIIYARLTSNGQRVEVSTGLKIEPLKWSKELHRVKGNTNSARVINNCLEEFRNKVYSIFSSLMNRNVAFTVFDVADVLKGVGKRSKSVLSIIDLHNSYKKELIGIDIKETTHEKFMTLKKHIQGFFKEKLKKDDIGIDEFTYPVLLEFEYYLKVNLGIAHNTAVKYIRNFRTIINYAIEIELIEKDPFIKYKSKVKEVLRGYLTQQELETIEQKQFDIVRLKIVKDIFIFCCYTGLAYIDIFKLKMDQINMGIDGEMWIETKREKTANPVRVMILPPAWDIIKRYSSHPSRITENRVLPVLTNQKMNAYLKEIGDICNINKRLSTHLARHTFATTVTLQRGIPIESVSKMLGHSNLKTTQIYAKITNDKVSKDMLKLKAQFQQASNQEANSQELASINTKIS